MVAMLTLAASSAGTSLMQKMPSDAVSLETDFALANGNNLAVRVTDGGKVVVRGVSLNGQNSLCDIDDGEVEMLQNLNVGESAAPLCIGNKLRTSAGGKIKCESLTVYSGNGLAPVVAADGSGIVNCKTKN